MSLPLRLLILSLLLLAAAPARADRIDDFVRAQMRTQHIPGLSVTVVRNGVPQRTRAYGLADLERRTPVRPETVFQIQSMTKSFVAVGIQMLAEERRLDLGNPVSQYFEGTPAAWKDITLRHLLTHTSGIKDFINEPTANLRLEVTEEQVYEAARRRPLNFRPGERYAYSNTNYHLLGMIIRKLTGKWYGDFLKERIFDPLEMRDTRIISLEDLIPDRASGYRWNGAAQKNGGYVAASILGYAGGGIRSTGPDLAKWDLALRNHRLLPKTRQEEMWTRGKLNNGAETGYGLGWGVDELRGHRLVSHTGAHFTGFTSAMLRFPEDDLSVYVLANQRQTDIYALAQGVAQRALPRLAPDLPRLARVSATDLERCTGRYEMRPNSMLEIVRSGRKLIAISPSGYQEVLRPTAADRCVGEESGMEFAFTLENGTARELTFTRPNGTLRGARIGPLLSGLPTGTGLDADTDRRVRKVLTLLPAGGAPVHNSPEMTPGSRTAYADGLPALAHRTGEECLAVHDAPAGLVRHGSAVARVAYYRLQLEEGTAHAMIFLAADGLFTDLDLIER